MSQTEELSLGVFHTSPAQRDRWRKVPKALGLIVVGFIVAWIVVLADRSWTIDTSNGSILAEPGDFVATLLAGLTIAGLYFVVSSGFTLIFGLMQTVNMAHGSFFLLSAYIAIELQQSMVGKSRSIRPEDVSLLAWFVPLLVGAAAVALLGVIIQQVFLKWNQGQDLRQAIITVAVTVILADQMLVQFGAITKTMVFPSEVVHFFELFGGRIAVSRLFMLAVSLVVGASLWLWLNKTRMGMIIRAGVDDEKMVRALGINISVVFGVTFFVGSFLAGVGGAMGASFSGAAVGVDGQWLLNSLVVVIIGGLGSLKGAAAGSLLLGMATNFLPAYLPSSITFASTIVTFVILAIVLAVRPSGLYGRTT